MNSPAGDSQTFSDTMHLHELLATLACVMHQRRLRGGDFMAKVLVVFYSRTGTVARVAEALARELGADLDQIEDACPRVGVGGYLRSAVEAIAKGVPSIRSRVDPSGYDLVVLGSPVWVGTMAAPMRSYLFGQRGALRNVALFAVMAGAGAETALREMRALCGNEDAPSCAFHQREVKTGAFRKRLRQLTALAHRSLTEAGLATAAA